MSTQEIAEAAMQLPEKDRLEVARRIVASVAADQETSAAIKEAVKGIEDVVTGKGLARLPIGSTPPTGPGE